MSFSVQSGTASWFINACWAWWKALIKILEPGPVMSDVGARQEALDWVRASSGSGCTHRRPLLKRP